MRTGHLCHCSVRPPTKGRREQVGADAGEERAGRGVAALLHHFGCAQEKRHVMCRSCLVAGNQELLAHHDQATQRLFKGPVVTRNVAVTLHEKETSHALEKGS